MLLLLKLALPPVLVAVVSLVARKGGPMLAGMLVGLPWMTGPVLYFLALDKGTDFAVEACIGIELGVVCVAIFILAYAAASSFMRWPVCVAVGAIAFAAGAWALRGSALDLPSAAAIAVVSLAVTYLLLPRPCAPSAMVALPWWDIPARMLSAFTLVTVILFTADLLGPQLSGIVSTYPSMVTVVSAFTHHQWGLDAVRRVLRGMTLSLLVFVGFFLVVGLSLPGNGLAPSFVLASVLGLAAQGIALVAARRFASI
jgi:hypothetical protein